MNMEKQEESINQLEDELTKELKPIIQLTNKIYDNAVVAYTPLVDDICRRRATEKEVDWLLTGMLDFDKDKRMAILYKRVCTAYREIYPETVAFYNKAILDQ